MTASQTVPLDVALQQAVAHHQAGRLSEAEDIYRAILQALPNHPDANHNLGVLAIQVGQHSAALPYLKAALDANPAREQYWLSYAEALLTTGQPKEALGILNAAMQRGFNSGEVKTLQQKASAAAKRGGTRGEALTPAQINRLVELFNSGRHAELESLARSLTQQHPDSGFAWKALGTSLKMQDKDALYALQKTVELLPDDAEAHSNLGGTLQTLGQLDDAVASCRRALEINPDLADAQLNLAFTQQGLGQLDDAVVSYRRALQIKPHLAEAHYNLGIALQALEQFDDAVASYRRALAINPNLAEAHYNLGTALQALGKLDDAMTSFRLALQIKPDLTVAHLNLAVALQGLGRLDDAVESCRRALQLKPDYAEAHSNLGVVLRELCQLDDAVESFHRALQLKPDMAEVHSNLGGAMQDIGQIDDAVESFRRALAINPNYADVRSNLIFSLDMSPAADLAELHKERKKWDATHAAPLWQDPVHANDRSPDRRLRIGYVSGDLRAHSAARTLIGLLTRYDRSQFDVFAYSTFQGREDSVTEQFKQSVTVWRNIGSLSNDAAAKIIREDRIDILVDLSGHSAGNRLLVFARKPAPIQATGWGYGTSTGMRAMDVFFTDPVVVPPEDKQYFTEEVRYLSSVGAPFFIGQYPDVNELPALSNGIITFGSFNRLVKISDMTYRAWAEVLLAVPNSRLLLKTAELSDAATRARVVEHFTQAGIAPERIIMQGKTPWDEHVQAYNQVDLALDPFPHGGGVTSLEGLMMGVPLVTLRWPTIAGRVSASIMTVLGLTDWIAESQEQYVALAIQKVGDLQSLAALRRQLRGIFTSVIGNQEAYVRTVEQEYRYLWQRWCSQKLDPEA